MCNSPKDFLVELSGREKSHWDYFKSRSNGPPHWIRRNLTDPSPSKNICCESTQGFGGSKTFSSGFKISLLLNAAFFYYTLHYQYTNTEEPIFISSNSCSKDVYTQQDFLFMEPNLAAGQSLIQGEKFLIQFISEFWPNIFTNYAQGKEALSPVLWKLMLPESQHIIPVTWKQGSASHCFTAHYESSASSALMASPGKSPKTVCVNWEVLGQLCTNEF